VAAAAAAAAIVIAASGLGLALALQTRSPHHNGGAAPVALQGGSSPEATDRHQAATWVAQQVSRGVTVSCDRAMCSALQQMEQHTGHLLAITASMRNPLKSAVIIATEAVRQQFGSRLQATYAPAVLASFGTGNQRVDIREIAPHGAAAYRSALNADLRARQASGLQLLDSSRIAVLPVARTQLLAGQVDSRLLITLAGLAGLNPIHIVDFGGSAPGASPSSPLRFVDLTENADGLKKVNSAYVSSMLAFLKIQRGHFALSHNEPLRLVGGQNVLRVEFSAPSPLGLLGPQSSS
jgi:hypothetical protein